MMAQEIGKFAAKNKTLDVPVIDMMPEPVNEITIRDIMNMLRRRRKIMGAIFSLGVIGTAVFLLLVTPKYQAVGQLLMDNRASLVRNINSVIATPQSDLADVPNEVQILMSRVLAGVVVDKLGLAEDPEFNASLRSSLRDAIDGNGKQVSDQGGVNGALPAPAAQTKPAVVSATEMNAPTGPVADAKPGDKLSTQMVSADKAPAEHKEVKADAAMALMHASRVKILDAFLKRLEVKAEKRSRVIEVAFESADSKKAAKVVNTLMESYLTNQVQYQKKTLTKATERLKKIVADLKVEVSHAEAAMQKYRESKRLIDVRRGTNIAGQQLAEFNSRLVQAQAEEAASSARLKQMLVLLKSDGSVNAAPEVLRSALIQRLREKETELLRERSDLVTRYGDRHPRMIKVQAELQNLRQKIKDEVSKIVEGLTNELAIARAKTKALREGLQKLETLALNSNDVQVQMDEFERDLASKRKQYETFQLRLRETSAQQEMIEPTARIVSFAEVSSKPSFPKKGPTIAIAMMFSALIAFVVVLVTEALRRTFETMSEAENVLGARPLGAMPKIGSVNSFLTRPEESFAGNSNLHMVQSVQSVRSTLYLVNDSQHPKSILMTSALPGEGKTELALIYASFCALKGQRVIVLDCDFINPRIHQHLSVANGEGLSDALTGSSSLPQVIRTFAEGGFDFISSGAAAVGKPELLDAAAMQELLQTLSWDYDVIIVDTSPVLSVANAPVLAKQMDSTVFVIQWRKSRRDLAKIAVERLQNVSGAAIGGFVLSDINPRRYEGADNLFDKVTSDDVRDGFFSRLARRFGLGGGLAGAASHR